MDRFFPRVRIRRIPEKWSANQIQKEQPLVMRPDVLFVIKTCGLEYDDRVRKECLSLSHLKKSVLILVLDDRNENRNGTTHYHIPFQSLNLGSRKIFPQAKGLLVKTAEVYVYCLIHILRTRPKTLWLHNIEMTGLIPLVWLLKKMRFVEKIIWDQHELPPDFIIKRRLFASLLFAMCDTVIVASNERKEFLCAKMKRKYADKISVLENFPDRTFAHLQKQELPEKIKSWLNGSPYLLAQGGANPDRYFEQLVEAMMRFRRLKLIVVGPYEERQKKKLEEVYGDLLDKTVCFTGFYPQLELTKFIDHAIASIVLYRADDHNNRLCASNRMYQSIVRGTAVVVGCNPPMANFIKRTGFGVALDGDGSDVQDIVRGIHHFLSAKINHQKIGDPKGKLLWENQERTISTIVS